MKYWNEYYGHDIIEVGNRKKYDNTIMSFDIETTSYLIYNNELIETKEYEKYTKEQQRNIKKQSCMYIWMFSINTDVYYGRTWSEFIQFLNLLEEYDNLKKIVFVHNLSFEFQYIKSILKFKEVFARKERKPIKAEAEDYNIEFRCSYMMSNCSLDYLPKLYNLPIKKLVGNLDYTKIRHSETKLNKKELAYCENDCLVVYYYIKEELKKYHTINKIPITSTGHLRRELQERIEKNWSYKNKVKKDINTDGHIFNLLQDAFMRTDIHMRIGFMQIESYLTLIHSILLVHIRIS